MNRYWFEIEEQNEIILNSFVKEIGIKLHKFSERPTSKYVRRCGSGFGNNVWRINYPKKRIEASFEKPCSRSKKLKEFGYRWDNKSGVWYSPNNEYFAECANSIGLERVGDILIDNEYV